MIYQHVYTYWYRSAVWNRNCLLWLRTYRYSCRSFSIMLTQLNKTFSIKIQMRSTRLEKSLEHNHLISSQNCFKILMNDHIDLACDFACDFRIDFVAYLLCVLRINSNIDSSRDDQNRIDFDLHKNHFEHLNKRYDSDVFSIWFWCEFLIRDRFDE